MTTRAILAIAAPAAVVAASAWWSAAQDSAASGHMHTVTRTARVEAAPLCPWREPQKDLRAFFPTATGTREDLRILSHLRVQLTRELGHAPTGDDLLLRPIRALRGDEKLGSILVRRVKGEFGAIEIVLAVDPDGRVRGLRLQRLREPEAIAAALTDAEWLSAFRGKTVDAPLTLGRDLPRVAAPARISATAVADGVRSLLILLRAAETQGRDGGRAS